MLSFPIYLSSPSRITTKNPVEIDRSITYSEELTGSALTNVKMPTAKSAGSFMMSLPHKLYASHYSKFLEVAKTHAFFGRQTKFVMQTPTRIRIYTAKKGFMNVFEFNIKHLSKVLEWLRYGGENPMIHKHSQTPEYVKVVGTSSFYTTSENKQKLEALYGKEFETPNI